MTEKSPLAALYAPPKAQLADRPGEALPGSMRIAYELTLRDLLRFRLLHQVTNKAMYIYGLFVVVLAASFFSGWDDIPGTLMAAGFGYAAFIVFMFVLVALATLLMRKSNLLAPHACELREDGYYDESGFYRCLHYWKSIVRVADRSGYVGIYVQANAAFIIPDRAFRGEVERNRFIDIATQRAAGAKEPRANGRHRGEAPPTPP